MKKVIAMVVLMALCAVPAFAGTSYVTDRFEVNVRAGAGMEYRIIRMLNSGQQVEILERGTDWTRIQIPGGQEGWTLTRFLQSDPPARVTVRDLTARIEPLERERAALVQENERLTGQNREYRRQLDETEKQLEASVAAYEKLREDAQDFLDMKEKQALLTASIEEKTIRISELEGKVTEQYLFTTVSWFLAGAGVLLLGMLLGKRSRKKRPGLR